MFKVNDKRHQNNATGVIFDFEHFDFVNSEHISQPCTSVSIVNFEQVNAGQNFLNVTIEDGKPTVEKEKVYYLH